MRQAANDFLNLEILMIRRFVNVKIDETLKVVWELGAE